MRRRQIQHLRTVEENNKIAEVKEDLEKLTCPWCYKKFKAAGLKVHIRQKHPRKGS